MSNSEKITILANVLWWTLAAPFVLTRDPVVGFTKWRRTRPLPGAPVPGEPAGGPRFDATSLIALADRVLLTRFGGRLVFRTRCLKRTLVVWRLLRAHGHDVVAVIGFDRDHIEADGQPTLAGHAWLELNGARIPDPVFSPPRNFTPFLAISDTTRALNDRIKV